MSSIPRFFISPGDIAGGRVTLPPVEAHHARNVLRLRPGDAIGVLDGSGQVYACHVETCAADGVVALVDDVAASTSEPHIQVTVAQALPKGSDKLEQVLQHGTEIGAAAFTVFPAQRSVARLEPGKQDKRLQRWNAIVKSAAEQSGRGMLPDVSWTASYREVLGSLDRYGAVFIAHESAATSLKAALTERLTAPATLLVLVGPEGGFTDDEVASAIAAGALPILLGPRVLRTETAALVALSQILYALE